MQWIDILILIPLILGAYIGFQHGFFSTMGKFFASILALILSVFLCGILFEILHYFCGDFFLNYQRIIAFTLSFSLSLSLAYFSVRFLSQKGFKALKMEGLDAIFGGFMGVFRGAFIVWLFVWMAEFVESVYPMRFKKERENSVMYQFFVKIHHQSSKILYDHPNLQAIHQDLKTLYQQHVPKMSKISLEN